MHLARAAGLEGFQKLLVLKRILPHLSADPDFVRMFLAEARLAAILDHPNVVQVFDIGRDANDYFFTMEYVYGETLQGILRDARQRNEPLPIEHAVTIGVGAALGLHYAHDRVGFDGMPLQLVHRDVSPTNVMVTYDGCVKVADFGIAKVTTRTDVTQAGIRKGKVPYMSPEQCVAGPLDRRSDVFALGIVLYECTTMMRLFDGDNEFGIMNRIVNGDFPPPSTRRAGYPRELEQIVLRALARDRDHRYASAGALAADLEQFARDRRLRATQAGLGEYMHARFAPRPFPFGALLGGSPQARHSSSGAAFMSPGTSLPPISMPSDVTPASSPSATAASQRSRVSWPSVSTPNNTLRQAAIGLGLVAALSIVALVATWIYVRQEFAPVTTSPSTAAPNGSGTSAPAPASAAPPGIIVPAGSPVPAPTSILAPGPATESSHADADPDGETDRANPRRRKKPPKKAPTEPAPPVAESKADIDAFLPD